MSIVEKRLVIAVPIAKVWDALTKTSAIEAWMNDPSAVIELHIGGHFELFGGETIGKFTEIQEPSILEYTWRQSSWPGAWGDSRVRWELQVDGNNTAIYLKHSAFPNDDERNSHDEGWNLYWLEPMQDWLTGD